MFDLLEPDAMSVAVYTPLDGLIAEYRQKRAAIVEIAGYVAGQTDVMTYFLNGAQVEHGYGSLSANNLFQADHAIRSLDAYYWSMAMNLTDVLEVMDAKRRNEWSEQIRGHKTPPFEPENVKATLQDLMAQRQKFFAERIDGLFNNLSDEHVTNSPMGFGKRMIIGWVLDSYGFVNHSRVEYLHDLRTVVAKFMGRGEVPRGLTYKDVDAIHRAQAYGEWHSFDGGSWRIRLYKKGTAHLEIHPEMAWRLNQVLAWLHPAAIPSEFRKKPSKPRKEFDLRVDLLPFEVITELENGYLSSDGQRLTFHSPVKEATRRALEYVGGTPEGLFGWAFDYDITEVRVEILRLGYLPERVSHQYFPTPPGLACRVIEMAEIGPDDTVLEPSAGLGGIADLLPVDQTTCVEISKLHCKVLVAKGFNTVCTDFLAWNPGVKFGKIVMNPPFANGRAIVHLQHAASLLQDDGVLVAVMPGSLVRKQLIEGYDHEWSAPVQGEFEDTGVSVAVVRLTKEASSQSLFG
ncbi:DUF4942 domain-containing protein [Thiobacillus denitrificans]|uniref:DUF4942 domain-containing protein n=1 Tax=Thiobacillus denitrificans TaxID=36861 RepID=UPI0003768380|nr:DUF4942 domain-containing protein [Thiobacillus denitrificans]